MTATPMISADRHRITKSLASACRDAKREMPVVGNEEHPTPWDVAHSFINGLLDELQALRAN